MTLADEIREFVLVAHIKPARRRGDATVVVRAGDVHEALGLKDRMPSVCGALDAAKFQEMAGVRLVNREGPPQGANVFFTFELMAEVESQDPAKPVVKEKYRGSKEYHLVFSELLTAARCRGTLLYQEVAEIMGLPLLGNYMANEIGQLLGEISEAEVLEGRPMLSAIVVSSVTGVPGEGFFTLAKQIGRLKSVPRVEEVRFWEKEKEDVYAAWQRDLKTG